MNKFTIFKLLGTIVALWVVLYILILTNYVSFFKKTEFSVKFPQSVPSENNVLKKIEDELPSVPLNYFDDQQLQRSFNKTCARYPKLFDLDISNGQWQTLQIGRARIELFGAYLDRRKGKNIVRILGMIDTVNLNVTTHCQVWYDARKTPMLIPVTEYRLIWSTHFFEPKVPFVYQPYLLSCVLPGVKDTPSSVSLVRNKCDDARNNLKINYNEVKEKKDLGFPDVDLSVKLVEWIELLGILGAEKVYFYEFGLHERTIKVLKYYEALNRTELTPLTLAGGQPNGKYFRHYYFMKEVWRKRLNELISYNDCFYKHMYEYKYILLLDVDEIMMPNVLDNWRQLMTSLHAKTAKRYDSYCARVAYYLDNLQHDHEWVEGIPKHMHMLQHVNRLQNHSKPLYYIKCFHDTAEVVTLHNHIPFSCVSEKCSIYSIDVNDAQVNHYRPNCVWECNLDESVKDTSIWRYKSGLVKATNDVLAKMFGQ